MLTSPEFKLNQLMDRDSVVLAETKIGVKGRYQLTVRRHGEVVQQTDWFDNLILNQGLDYIGLYNNGTITDSGPFQYAQVGTGTSTATATQTQLDALLNYTARSGTTPTWANSGSPNYILTVVFTYAFSQGAVVGNISEVGIGRLSTAGGLFSRARILDGSNNPTTITLTSIDQLTVSYALSVVPSLASVSSSVVLDGITYPYTAYTTAAGSGVGTIVGYPSIQYPWFGFTRSSPGSDYHGQVHAAGTPLSPTVLTDTSVPGSTGNALIYWDGNPVYSYTAGTYTGLLTFRVNPAQGNFAGGIQCILMDIRVGNANPQVLYYFSTPIPKLNTQRLTLVLSLTWSNA